MIKNLVYNLLYFIDILFLYVQYSLIKLFNKKKFNYVLFFGGWGQLVQSVFISHLLNKKDYKLILVLDYDKFNLRLEDFSPKHKIKKIYSLFKLINRDFSQYPSNIQKDIKKLCSSIFCDDFINLEKILYNEDQTFLNKNLLSNYFKRTIKNNIKISHSIISFNSSKFNTKINKFFYPKKEIKNLIQKKLKIKDNEIKKKSINITFRLRNKSFNNFDRTNYLRDSNFKNLKIIINYLLKNTDYTLFITGDCDQIDINHKNLIYYQKVKKQISKNLYTLAIQTLSNYHILQASGANELIKFNKCKASLQEEYIVRSKILTDLSALQLNMPSKVEGEMKKVFLLGPSRSGKTTLEYFLAKHLNGYRCFEPIKNASLNSKNFFEIENSKNAERNAITKKLFYIDERVDLDDYHFICSTNPHSLKWLSQIVAFVPNSYFIIIERDKEKIATDIFRNEFIHGNAYAYKTEEIYEYLEWYYQCCKVLEEKLSRVTTRVVIDELPTQPMKVINKINAKFDLCQQVKDLDENARKKLERF